MADLPPLDAFHAHEVLHTASIIADLFEQRVTDHPFTQQDAELRLAAERIGEQLHDFYQMVGAKTLS